jgi:hypothetical protein
MDGREMAIWSAKVIGSGAAIGAGLGGMCVGYVICLQSVRELRASRPTTPVASQPIRQSA